MINWNRIKEREARNKMNGRYQFGWVIKILSKDKDDQGFQTEIADLGNGKHMIIATDISNPISKDSYRQAGFGPFLLEKDQDLSEQMKTLKNDLLERRNK
jgi:hypothetical protein